MPSIYRVTLVVEYLGWVDLDLRSSPGWWADIVATLCPSRVVEHAKSRSTQPRYSTTRVTLYSLSSLAKTPLIVEQKGTVSQISLVNTAAAGMSLPWGQLLLLCSNLSFCFGLSNDLSDTFIRDVLEVQETNQCDLSYVTDHTNPKLITDLVELFSHDQRYSI